MTRVARTLLAFIYGRTLRDSLMALIKNLLSIPGVADEKDELYRAELNDKYKEVKEAERVLSIKKAELQKIRQLEAKSKGRVPAYINNMDLITIIEDLLLTKSTVRKAFDRHEVNDGKCAEWAKRTIRYSVDKDDLTQAIDCVPNNTRLLLMKKHSVLDIKSMIKSGSYSEALNKIKRQLDIALRLQDKDDQLAVKDKTISDKDSEIERLEKELLRNKSDDWQHEAIKLKKSGVSVAEIARLLSKGRTTISTYLNKPDVKSLITGSS